ncbi:MAG: 50S ribosomal protein L21 [Thermoanaerobaculia bacterium]|nr:50S ribosomal protein L21 [Thermoanaerobaculia bacterium]
MFAIIETGGKQYRVTRGDVIDVERRPVSGEKVPKIEFDRVLMVSGEGGVKIGSPVISGARVSGVVLDEVRWPKVKVFKKKRRKRYRRTQGHRQNMLRVRIQDIEL